MERRFSRYYGMKTIYLNDHIHSSNSMKQVETNKSTTKTIILQNETEFALSNKLILQVNLVYKFLPESLKKS